MLLHIPRPLLLLLKTNDCLRAVDLALGQPVNTFIITARECTRALAEARLLAASGHGPEASAAAAVIAESGGGGAAVLAGARAADGGGGASGRGRMATVLLWPVRVVSARAENAWEAAGIEARIAGMRLLAWWASLRAGARASHAAASDGSEWDTSTKQALAAAAATGACQVRVVGPCLVLLAVAGARSTLTAEAKRGTAGRGDAANRLDWHLALRIEAVPEHSSQQPVGFQLLACSRMGAAAPEGTCAMDDQAHAAKKIGLLLPTSATYAVSVHAFQAFPRRKSVSSASAVVTVGREQGGAPCTKICQPSYLQGQLFTLGPFIVGNWEVQRTGVPKGNPGSNEEERVKQRETRRGPCRQMLDHHCGEDPLQESAPVSSYCLPPEVNHLAWNMQEQVAHRCVFSVNFAWAVQTAFLQAMAGTPGLVAPTKPIRRTLQPLASRSQSARRMLALAAVLTHFSAPQPGDAQIGQRTCGPPRVHLVSTPFGQCVGETL
eukprot:330937-Chlamydomonas_euryale.AAC.6